MLTTALEHIVLSPGILKRLKLHSNSIKINGLAALMQILFFFFKTGNFPLSTAPGAGGENQLHSTICQLPLETFNSNKIYGSSFQRILPVKFISTNTVVNATIVSDSDWWLNLSLRLSKIEILRQSMIIMYERTYPKIQSIYIPYRPYGTEDGADTLSCP